MQQQQQQQQQEQEQEQESADPGRRKGERARESADPGRRKGERVREEEVLLLLRRRRRRLLLLLFFRLLRPSLPCCFPVRGLWFCAVFPRPSKVFWSGTSSSEILILEVTLGIFAVQFRNFSVLSCHGDLPLGVVRF